MPPPGFSVQSSVPAGFKIVTPEEEARPTPYAPGPGVTKSFERLSGAVPFVGNMATSGVGSIVGGLAGLGSLALPTDDTRPNPRLRRMAEIAEAGASFRPFPSPGSEEGQRVEAALEAPLEAFAGAIEPITEGIMAGPRLDSRARAQEIGLSEGSQLPALGAGVASALTALPAAFGFRGRGKVPHRQQVAVTANEHGYTIPPASVTPGGVRGAAQGVGGVKIKNDASFRNQANTNRLAATELGLPPETVLTRQGLQSVRSQVDPVYNSIRESGRIVLDDTFNASLRKAAEPFRATAGEEAFATLSKDSRGQVLKIVEEMEGSAGFDAGAAIDAVRLLRDKASESFRGGNGGLGRAYREISNAIEDVIERDLSRSGRNPGLINEFRDARELIAKTFSVEDALKGSNVSAPALAAQANKGKPLSGNLKVIADTANEFPQSMRIVREPPTSTGVLDAAVGLGSLGTFLATGQPAALLPGLLPFARPAIRSGLLSKPGQSLNRPSIHSGSAGPLTSAEIARRRREDMFLR